MIADHPADDMPHAMHQAALDAMPQPVVIYDDTQILYANRAACLALGGSESAGLQGMSVQGFILPELAEVNNARRAYVIDQGVEIRNLILKIRGLDGEPLVLHVDIVPVSFEGSVAAMATLA